MIKKIIPKTVYGKNILTTIVGSGISQIFPILISPVLTRLYSPEEFGFLSVYLLSISLLTIFSTGKLENTFFISKNIKEVNLLFGLAVSLSIVFSLVLIPLIVFFGEHIWMHYDIDHSLLWLYLVPLAVFISSCFIIITQLSIRLSKYKKLSISRISLSFVNSSLSLVLGFFSFKAGLILSVFIGQGVAVLSLNKLANFQLYKEENKILKIIALLKKYKKIPVFMIPSGLVNMLSANMPTVILTSTLGLSFVGFYNLIQRVLAAPSAFIGNAFGEVFRQQAADDLKNNRNCRPLLIKTVFRLSVISLIPFLILGLYAPVIFSYVFGDKWIVAGELAQYLVPMFYIRFVTMPVASVILLRNRTEIDLYWQVMFLLLSLVAFYFENVVFMMIYFSCSYSFAYILSFLINFKLAKIND